MTKTVLLLHGQLGFLFLTVLAVEKILKCKYLRDSKESAGTLLGLSPHLLILLRNLIHQEVFVISLCNQRARNFAFVRDWQYLQPKPKTKLKIQYYLLYRTEIIKLLSGYPTCNSVATDPRDIKLQNFLPFELLCIVANQMNYSFGIRLNQDSRNMKTCCKCK